MNNTTTIQAGDTSRTMFESKVCSRCGGSGHYSYCQRYGTVCFGCGGKGVVLTKRGNAAQKFYNDLLSKPLGQVKPGDSVKGIGVTVGGEVYGQWERVKAVSLNWTESSYSSQSLVNGEWVPNRNHLVMGQWVNGLVIETDKTQWQGYSASHVVRVAAKADEKAAAREKALEFQAALTQKGEPRKR